MPASAATGDWPMYLYNIHRTSGNLDETTLNVNNASQLVNKWVFTTTVPISGIDSGPAVVGNDVYIGAGDGYEYALDAGTGALKWKTYLGVDSNSDLACKGSYGVTSSAAVDNGVIYVGGNDPSPTGTGTFLYALSSTTGTIMWKVKTGDQSAGDYMWSSPLLYNGYAYIGVASLCDDSLVQGELLQINLSTEAIAHTFKVVGDGDFGGGIWTSPSLDEGTNTLYVTTGNGDVSTQPYVESIVALDASTLAPKDHWQIPAKDVIKDGDWSTTPVLTTTASITPLVVAVNKNGFMYAFNRNCLSASSCNGTGGPLWKDKIDVGGASPESGKGSASSTSVGAGLFFQAGGITTIGTTTYTGSIRAVDPNGGAYEWQQGTAAPILPASSYVNGLVIDGDGPYVQVRNASNGTILYQYQTGDTLHGPAAVSNGQIFEGSMDGHVYAFGLPS